MEPEERKKIYQCGACKDFIDYPGTSVYVDAAGYGGSRFVRWCDECMAKVKGKGEVRQVEEKQASELAF